MYDIIKHHHAEKRVLVTSFHKEQNERFRAISNGEKSLLAQVNMK